VRAGRWEEAIERLSEARSIFEEEGDDRQLAWAVFYDAVAGWGIRPLEDTSNLFLNARVLHEKSKDMGGIFFSSMLAALALGAAGRHDESREAGDSFVETALTTDVPTLVAHALDSSAFFDALRNEVHAESFRRAAESLDKFRSYGNYACVAHALTASASVLARAGDRHAAGIAVGVSEGIRDHLSMIVGPHEDRGNEVVAVIAETDLIDVGADGPARDEWDSARNQGRTMAPDEGIDWTISRLERAGQSLEPDSA
jgi:hypothetical protein